jgi:hypothetical protein
MAQDKNSFTDILSSEQSGVPEAKLTQLDNIKKAKMLTSIKKAQSISRDLNTKNDIQSLQLGTPEDVVSAKRQERKGFLSRLKDTAIATIKDIPSDIKEGASEFMDAQKAEGELLADRIRKAKDEKLTLKESISTGFDPILKTFNNAMGGLFTTGLKVISPPELEEGVKQLVSEKVGDVMSTDEAQQVTADVIEWYQGLSPEDQGVLRTGGAGAEVIIDTLFAGGAKKGLDTLKNAFMKTAAKTDDIAKGFPKNQFLSDIINKYKKNQYQFQSN